MPVCLRIAGERGLERINKVLLVAFKKNEGGNAFWESQGFTLREDLNYRNKALAELIRIDPEYVK